MSSAWPVADRIARPLLFALALLPVRVAAQIGPPGMGPVRAAGWMAVGFTQRLDTAGRLNWSGYVGHGRSSMPQHGMPWQRPAILVVDQLLTRRIHPHAQVGLGMSFRSQQRYSATEPFERLAPDRDEGRLHARLALLWPIGHWRVQVTMKQELRRFFTPDLRPWKEDLEWRSRLKVQAEHPLDAHGRRRMVLAVEELFAMDHERSVPDEWTTLGYRESRLSAYLVQRIAHDRLEVAVGGMADVLRGDPAIGPYMVASIVWRDPFGRGGGRVRE